MSSYFLPAIINVLVIKKRIKVDTFGKVISGWFDQWV